MVEAKMTLHPIVWCFLAIWSWFVGPPAWRTIQSMWHRTDVPTEPMLLFMFLLAWLMTIGFFYFNAFRVKKLMFKLLELHDVS